jgi:hypothetical protein
MKKLLLLLLFISGITYSQIQVIHFNASWNASNDVEWFEDLTDAKLKRVDIATNTQAGTDHKITVVPTILILVDGEEEERYEADISFSIQATKNEIQEIIDEIVMDQF